MSSSVPSRPLSLRPFLAADGVLLFTALLIAWRTSGELAGGVLLGVIVCTCLGAVLTVLPFVLNDVREREAAQASRQRELVDLVNSSLATTSRWGAQWTAAATGLEDAAGLATRNLAAAERLPGVFQEKVDTLARLIEQAEGNAQAREERAIQLEKVLALHTEQAGSFAAELECTLAGFAQMNTGLREQHAALAAALAEFPAAAARAQSAREALDERLAAAPAQIEAQVAGLVTAALTSRLVGLGTVLDSLTEQLERVRILSALTPTPETVGTIEPRGTPVPSVMASPERDTKPVPKDAIMDPFHIPQDGYSALADAMDSGRRP